ncbi:hypothetical protein EVG20_g71 [Dentipellis fragilis]|uniref:40S ribosomal protein S18 n=1 Tax=Dentipellis fragilis TaxID=205917 RepID=A0A4Y9ZGG0_9AGAM|nr:hypothetical protein EVG20_g71 [Dentipellis fragilis]
MSLVLPEAHQQFQHILRLLNTNVDGKRKIMYALTEIKGVGRRYSNLVCKKADVDLNKRAGDLNSDELERLVTIIQNPTQFKIPRVPEQATGYRRRQELADPVQRRRLQAP